MTLFLCWSGNRSKQVAEVLKDYFEEIFGSSGHDVVMSETLIAKGAPWSAQLLDNLGRAGAGIVCLSPENRRSAWLHFESGAIATRAQAEAQGKLFGFLFTFESAQMDGPLSLFQATVYRRDYDRDRDELLRLTQAVLARFKQSDAEHPDALDRLVGRLRELHYLSFCDLLPVLEQHARRIVQATAADDLASLSGRAHALSAVLSLRHLLEDRARDIEVVCAPSQLMFFQRLIDAVSSAAGVLEESIAPMSGDVPAQRLGDRVENLRRMLEVAVEPLTPVLDDSWRYALYGLSGSPHEARHKQKLLLVHPLESRLQRAGSVKENRGEAVAPGHLLSLAEKPRALTSYWLWDRIAAYIHYCEDVAQWPEDTTTSMLIVLTRGVLKEIGLIEVPASQDRQKDDLPIRFALRALVLRAKLAMGYGRFNDPLKQILTPTQVREIIESRIRGETGLSFGTFDNFIEALRALSARIESPDSTHLDQPPLRRLVEDLARLLPAGQSQSAGA